MISKEQVSELNCCLAGREVYFFFLLPHADATSPHGSYSGTSQSLGEVFTCWKVGWFYFIENIDSSSFNVFVF